MGHHWLYRGDGSYGCEKCGQEADKSNVAEISLQDCPGDAGNEELAREVAGLAMALDAINTRVKDLEELKVEVKP
ncbi:unnamed protein product [marine sediment metagenome]|uniref:Uncharacterized protein n=1 Tax=marine sediment metagenome TaxID=412755 RepID=X1GWC0_9ZZZZ